MRDLQFNHIFLNIILIKTVFLPRFKKFMTMQTNTDITLSNPGHNNTKKEWELPTVVAISKNDILDQPPKVSIPTDAQAHSS